MSGGSATRRLAYSTLGCPGEPMPSVIERCRRDGLHAIELRSREGEPIHAGVASEVARRNGALLREAGVTLLALTTRVQLCSGEYDPVAEGVRELDAAAAVGAPAIRVYAGAAYEHARPIDVGRRRLATLTELADERGLRVLVETHDSHARGADVAELIEGMPANVGAIWDVLHPWRAGESPDVTAAALGDRLAYVQLKDWSAEAGLCLPGTGEVPLREVLAALGERVHTTWLSLEWERAWHPDLPPLDAALARLRGWVTESLAGPTTAP